jgi:hypothetical protein
MHEVIDEGTRVGRFIVLRDVNGRRHGIAAGSVAAVCDNDEGVLLLLPGGRIVQVAQSLDVILAWLTGS